MTGDGADRIPAGRLRVVVTYLEMAGRPGHAPAPVPLGRLALMHAENPTVSFYRYLYDTVGTPWLWSERRRIADGELAEILRDPKVEVYVLYKSGVPAGFAELDRRADGPVNLSYFGLIPEFIGQRLGPYLLDQVVALAWDGGAERLTVNTCTFDHPRALAMYQRAGFVPVRQEARLVSDPRLEGVLPRDAAPHVPLARAPRRR